MAQKCRFPQVATAVYQSATSGSVPLSLPLTDRVSRPFYPRPYRWLGGDKSGLPQTLDEVKKAKL